jgi:uncharacterized protein
MSAYLIRWIFIAVLLWAAMRWVRSGGSKPVRKSKKDGSVTVPLVRCAHCGVHLPQAEAIGDGQHYFCSAAHRDKGPAS